MERTVAFARTSTIEVDDFPWPLRATYGDVLQPSMEQRDTLRIWGSRYVRLVLERHGRNKRAACRALDISYHTLQAYLRYAHEIGGLTPDATGKTGGR